MGHGTDRPLTLILPAPRYNISKSAGKSDLASWRGRLCRSATLLPPSSTVGAASSAAASFHLTNSVNQANIVPLIFHPTDFATTASSSKLRSEF